MTLLRTPYYLIDERRLQHNLEIIRRVREAAGAKSVLALKCFSTWGVFGLHARVPRRHDEQLAVRGAARPRASSARRCTPTASPYTEDERRRRGSDIADKVIFNSIGRSCSGSRHLVDGRLDRAARQPRGQLLALRPRRPGAQHSRLGVTDDDELRCRRAAARRR